MANDCNKCIKLGADTYDRTKHCCRNCLAERFRRNAFSGNLELYCKCGNVRYNAATNYFFSCQKFLRRSAAYVLRPGCVLHTPDGKIIHYKEIPV